MLLPELLACPPKRPSSLRQCLESTPQDDDAFSCRSPSLDHILDFIKTRHAALSFRAETEMHGPRICVSHFPLSQHLSTLSNSTTFFPSRSHACKLYYTVQYVRDKTRRGPYAGIGFCQGSARGIDLSRTRVCTGEYVSCVYSYSGKSTVRALYCTREEPNWRQVSLYVHSTSSDPQQHCTCGMSSYERVLVLCTSTGQ